MRIAVPKSPSALVKPELLIWARRSAHLDRASASSRLRVSEARLRSWEAGDLLPTVRQLRRLASIYKQSTATFFLPAPPAVFEPPFRDFRCPPEGGRHPLTSDIALDSRLALDRREILLELTSGAGNDPVRFEFGATTRKNPEAVAGELRDFLGVTAARQATWREPRTAFNAWRSLIESVGVLVFQSVQVDLSRMRGYSIWMDPFPIVAVNRKDAYNGRTFTLFHELVHLALRASGICDLEEPPNGASERRKVEVLCNRVAAAALVPMEDLLSHPQVQAHDAMEWSDSDLRNLARRFGVSEEVVVRRLLELDRTSPEFYSAKRGHFAARKSARGKGFVRPSTDALSQAGKPFVRAVLAALHTDRITPNDAADYLGIKLKHLNEIEEGAAA